MTDIATHSSAPLLLPSLRRSLTNYRPRRMSERAFAAINADTAQPVDAAVLIAMVPVEDQLEVVLTRRVDSLRHHAGQVSFPGGRMDPTDTSLDAAARREANEEIGLPGDAVEVLGHLDELPTLTGFRVTPVVGLVTRPVAWVPNPDEVARVFQVPLAWLFDPANVTAMAREIRGHQVTLHRFEWEQEVIWGATAAMIMNLKAIVTGP
ncbi:MAG: CoA pyrophosphatase [Pseudomonadota bacterium]